MNLIIKNTLKAILGIIIISIILSMAIYIIRKCDNGVSHLMTVKGHIKEIEYGIAIDLKQGGDLLALSPFNNMSARSLEKYSSGKLKCENYTVVGGKIISANLCTSFTWGYFYGYSSERGAYILKEK